MQPLNYTFSKLIQYFNVGNKNNSIISPNAMNAFLPSNISNSSITPATPPTIPIASINTINNIFIFNKIPPLFTIVYHLTYPISGPYVINLIS